MSCVDGVEITYTSSFNSHFTPVAQRRRRNRRDVVAEPLDDLDLDYSFDPEVVINTNSTCTTAVRVLGDFPLCSLPRVGSGA